jgi:serine protease Do
VVKVEAADDHGLLMASGFFVDPAGTVVTSYTVGGETRNLTVIHDGRRLDATRIAADPISGLALLRADATVPFLEFANSDTLRVASPVIVLGYPLDFPITASFGLVGGFEGKHLGKALSTRHIRATALIQKGQGGAPLLNSAGAVVGVVVSSIGGGTGLFALPSEAVQKVITDVVRFGRVRRGWIGAEVSSGVPKGQPLMTQVQMVAKESPAERGGLLRGDVIVTLGGRTIVSTEDLLDASFYLTGGDPVVIEVMRGGTRMGLEIIPDDMAPGERGRVPALSASEFRLPIAAGQGKEGGE